MHKTRVYLAKSNDARSQDVNVVRSYLRLHDVEVVEHNPSTPYSNGPLLSSDYLVIIPAYNYVHEGKAAQRVSGKGICTEDFQINLGRGLYTQIMEFHRTKNIGEINTFVYTGKNTLFRTIRNIDTYNGTDWKQYAFITPSKETTELIFLKAKEPAYNADFLIKLTGDLFQFCPPSYDSYRTIDNSVITYKGKSRTDNAPMFNVKMNTSNSDKRRIKDILTNWRFAQWAGCVSGSFEYLEAEISETRDWTVKQWEGRMEREPVRTVAQELGPVMPMSAPDPTLYFFDVIHENKYRLLLAE